MPDLTVRQYAVRRDVSRVSVEKAIKDGRLSLAIVQRDPIVLDSELADREWAAHTRERTAGRPTRAQAEARTAAGIGAKAKAAPPLAPGEVGGDRLAVDYNDERALKARVDRKLAELNLLKAEGAVVPVEAARRLWQTRTRGLRDNLLAIAEREGAALSACSDPEGCATIVALAIRAALASSLPAEAPLPEPAP